MTCAEPGVPTVHSAGRHSRVTRIRPPSSAPASALVWILMVPLPAACRNRRDPLSPSSASSMKSFPGASSRR